MAVIRLITTPYKVVPQAGNMSWADPGFWWRRGRVSLGAELAWWHNGSKHEVVIFVDSVMSLLYQFNKTTRHFVNLLLLPAVHIIQ